MSFSDHLSVAARRLRDSADFPAPSESLQARVLDSVRIAPVPAPTLRLPLSWIAAPALVAAMAFISVTAVIRAYPLSQGGKQATSGSGFVTPLKPMTSAQLAALPQVQFALKIQQAVDRQNTWHLEGWQDNKKGRQRWEIWERRSPYFVREQIGGTTTISDGTTRTIIMTPEAVAQISPTGAYIAGTPVQLAHGSLIYITASMGSSSYSLGLMPPYTPAMMTPQSNQLPQYGNATSTVTHQLSAREVQRHEEDRVNSMSRWRTYSVNSNAADGGRTTLFAQDLPQWMFAKNISRMTEQYTIDRNTLLPQHYQTLRAVAGASPGSIPPYHHSDYGDQVVLSAQYGIDIPKAALTYTPPPDCQIVDMRLLIPQTFKDNLSIRTDEITQDKDGNIAAALTPELSDKFKANHALQDYFQINTSKSLYGTDENGMVYTLTMMDDGQQPAHFRFWLAPLTPYPSTVVHPKRLTLHVPINITTFGPGGLSGGGTGSGGGTAFWQTVELSLPNAAASVPLPKYTIWHIGGKKHYSLAELAAVARAKFYENGVLDISRYKSPLGLKLKPSDIDRSLAARWWETAAVEADKVGDDFSARTFKLMADHTLHKSEPRAPATTPLTLPMHK